MSNHYVRLAPLRAALLVAVAAMFCHPAAHAQATRSAASVTDTELRQYDIPAGALSDTLLLIARQSGNTISVAQALVNGLNAPAISGRFTAEQAAQQALSGSGLQLARTENGTLTVQSASSPAQPTANDSVQTMRKVRVTDNVEPGELPTAYPGGKIARGGRAGVLGNGDFMEVPMSIVVFTSEFRDDTLALSVSDMLKYSVSAQTPQAGSMPTTDGIYLRGFGAGTYDGTFDGLPGLLGRMPPVEGVERVEMLLGANAFANGQPSVVGGNLNIVPKRASEESLLRIGANYRTESILGGTLDTGMRFGPDKAFGVRANAAYSNGDTELADGRRRAFSRALAFDYRGQNTRFTFDYMGNDRRLPAEAWFVIASGVGVPDADRVSRDFRQPWTYYRDNWDAVVTRGEWDFAKNWTASIAYGHMWTRVERFSQVNELIDDNGAFVDAYVDWGGSLGRSKQRREAQASEAMVRGEFDTGPFKHRVRFGHASFGDTGVYAGAYSDHYVAFASNIYRPVDYAAPNIEMPQLPSHDDSRHRNTGLFASDEIGMFDDRLRVIAGARRVQYKTEYYNGAEWRSDPAKQKWSPAFGLLFKVQPWLTLYANKLESLDAGYQVQDPALNTGQILSPLPADQVEVGAKADFGKLAFTAAVFEIDKPNYYLNPSTLIEGANGRQLNRGVELSLFGEAMTTLRLYSSATFIDAKMKKTQGGVYDGREPISVARFLANAHADWDIAAVQGLALLGSVSYSGSVYNDELNAQKLKPWTRFDAGLRYRTQVFGLPSVFRLNIDNLLDKNYFVSERGSIYLAPMRTLVLSGTIDFR